MHQMTTSLAVAGLLLGAAGPAWSQDSTRPRAERQTALTYAATEQKKGTGADRVAAQLARRYRASTGRISEILMDAGYRPPQVLHALLAEGIALDLATEEVGRYGGGPPSVVSGVNEYTEMAGTLADGGYSATEVAEVLVAVYEADAETVVAALRSADYPADEIAEALRVELGADAAAAASALRSSFAWPTILAALTSDATGFPGDLPDHVSALYAAGCSRQYVQSALEQVVDGSVIAQWLATVLQP